jgi:hypothetical protein
VNRAALAVLLLAIAACQRAPEPPPKPTAAHEETSPLAAPVVDIDGDNLLNIAYGAAVVSRTGELNLEASAAHAIDGLSFSTWSSSPGASAQTLVFALGGPSRIERVGVTTVGKDLAPERVRIAASTDGVAWRDVVTLTPAMKGTTIVDVKPFEARYLRVETLESNKYYVALASVHALGRELRPAERLSFGGCWTINGKPARFEQRGARLTGVIAGERPTYVDGGIDGRVAKLMWMRGPMWGLATATLTPDARGITAITFHEEPLIGNFGEAWIGTRCDGVATATTPRKPHDFLNRVGHWTMSGIIFDAEDRLVEEPSRGTLDDAATLLNATPRQRFRLVAHEFRNADPDENRRRTTARVEAIRDALRARGVDVTRLTLVGNGSERKDVETPSALQRMLWSRVDLER